MPHRFHAVQALRLATLTGLGLVAVPVLAQEPSTPASPTVTTPAPAAPSPPPVPEVPAASPVAAAPPPKQTPVAPAPAVSVSGEIDGYFQLQFANTSSNQDLNGRIYAFRNKTPTLRLAWVDVYHTPKPGSFGFKASLATGDAADRDVPNSGSGVGEAQFKNLAQLYGTYTAQNGFNIDLGKFLSPYGYDTTEATLNYNYTLTLATYLVPNYVAGVRATYPFKSPNLAASVFVVNSLEETPTAGVHDDNNKKDIILRLNYTTPDGKFNYIPAYGFGEDKLSGALGPGGEKIVLFDNWLTYHATSKTTFAGEYVYRKDSDRGGHYMLRGDGYGVYARQQVTGKNAVALRYSVLAKQQSDLLPLPTTKTSFQADEVTATFETKVAPNFTVRYEYRHDHSNNASLFGYPSGQSGNPKSDQDAALVAGLFTF